jgi:hypothetical protein
LNYKIASSVQLILSTIDPRLFRKIRRHDAVYGHVLADRYVYGANKSPLPSLLRDRYQLPDPSTTTAGLSGSGRGVTGLFINPTLPHTEKIDEFNEIMCSRGNASSVRQTNRQSNMERLASYIKNANPDTLAFANSNIQLDYSKMFMVFTSALRGNPFHIFISSRNKYVFLMPKNIHGGNGPVVITANDPIALLRTILWKL